MAKKGSNAVADVDVKEVDTEEEVDAEELEDTEGTEEEDASKLEEQEEDNELEDEPEDTGVKYVNVKVAKTIIHEGKVYGIGEEIHLVLEHAKQLFKRGLVHSPKRSQK